jgi:inner membrane protein involved in colicin E2 resistance
MNTSSPTAALPVPPPLPLTAKIDRRNAVTLKLLFIAGLVLLLQVPLYWVSSLRQERAENRSRGFDSRLVTATAQSSTRPAANPAEVQKIESRAAVFVDGYRMVERSLKYGVLVLALVFAAFFIFEIVAGMRVHAVHYILIGAALCLFYMALLALGEVIAPSGAYLAAAGSSSLLITLYSAAVLRAWLRAGVIAGLLAAVHSVLFVVLRMEDFALLAGTGALFVALSAVMFFTRNVDWYTQDVGSGASKEQAATS